MPHITTSRNQTFPSSATGRKRSLASRREPDVRSRPHEPTSGKSEKGGLRTLDFDIATGLHRAMQRTMLDKLVQAYEPLVGRRLLGLAWMPLPSDTPDLVREFGGSSFSFTGAVQLRFEPDKDISLSWRAKSPMTLSVEDEESRWGEWSLDRIGPDMNSAWIDLPGSTLVGVDLFTCSEEWTDGLAPLDGAPVGARHRLEKNGAVRSFWIGTAYGNNIREADDLWVGLNVDPQNLGDLALVATLPGKVR